VAAFVYNPRAHPLVEPMPTLRPFATQLAFLLLWGSALPAAGAIPVILDTDIGDDIDDTWALVLALKSPELDIRLVVTDFGDTEYRAKLVARLLETAGRTEIPIGIGVRQHDRGGPQAAWVAGYDLARYPGRVLSDGVQAIVDTTLAAKEPLALVACSPPVNLKAALEREPRIAGRLRLVGMYGSLRRGSEGKPVPEPEWNVKMDKVAARVVFAAPWAEAIVTPLDTCGIVRLKGERYARIRDSRDPLLQALMENYRLWCPRSEWCANDPEHVVAKSSVLYDTVAVYLAITRGLVRTESLGVRVTDEGMTVPDASARPIRWATEWTDLDAYGEWLATRLAGPTPRR
jgi:inosine-uridine nucleoside N-ribohydrolase